MFPATRWTRSEMAAAVGLTASMVICALWIASLAVPVPPQWAVGATIALSGLSTVGCAWALIDAALGW